MSFLLRPDVVKQYKTQTQAHTVTKNIIPLFLVVYDDEAVEKMLDRTLDDESVPEDEDPEATAKTGLNDYLRSFKVATYRVKEGEEVNATLV